MLTQRGSSSAAIAAYSDGWSDTATVNPSQCTHRAPMTTKHSQVATSAPLFRRAQKRIPRPRVMVASFHSTTNPGELLAITARAMGLDSTIPMEVMYVRVRERSPRHIKVVATSRIVTRRARRSGENAWDRADRLSQGAEDEATSACTLHSGS